MTTHVCGKDDALPMHGGAEVVLNPAWVKYS
jgi:hypothetical protein